MASSMAHGRRPTWLVVVGAAALLVALNLASSAAAKGTKATGKSDTSVFLIEETTTNVTRVAGPAGLKPKNGTRKDASVQVFPRPSKVEQVPGTDVAVAGGGAGNSTKTGRKLLALGDPCSIYITNLCSSRASFQVAFGYYTYNGVRSGYLSGWQSEGWWTLGYGQTGRFLGSQTLYVFTTTGLVPSSAISAAYFCVSLSGNTILMADNGWYYSLNPWTNYYYRQSSCAAAGGVWVGNFYAPAYCGVNILYYGC